MPLTGPKLHRKPVGPSNKTSIVYGYDASAWHTSYRETFGQSFSPATYRDARPRVYIDQSRFDHKDPNKYLTSNFQESYPGVKPETTASIYKERRKELKINKDLFMVDSTFASELEFLNKDIKIIPKSTMNNDYVDRQRILPNWVAVQAPKLSTLPLRNGPKVTVDRREISQEGLTEFSHQYQWPLSHPSDIYETLYKFKRRMV